MRWLVLVLALVAPAGAAASTSLRLLAGDLRLGSDEPPAIPDGSTLRSPEHRDEFGGYLLQGGASLLTGVLVGAGAGVGLLRAANSSGLSPGLSGLVFRGGFVVVAPIASSLVVWAISRANGRAPSFWSILGASVAVRVASTLLLAWVSPSGTLVAPLLVGTLTEVVVASQGALSRPPKHLPEPSIARSALPPVPPAARHHPPAAAMTVLSLKF